MTLHAATTCRVQTVKIEVKIQKIQPTVSSEHTWEQKSKVPTTADGSQMLNMESNNEPLVCTCWLLVVVRRSI
jgi:hypothetical protein